MSSRFGRLFVPFVVVSALFAGGTLAGGWAGYSAWAAGASPYPAWDTMARAFYMVRTRYVDDIDEQELVYSALNGMTRALDPHSAFFDPKRYADVVEQEKKRYFGIGTQVVGDPLGLKVTGVIPRSPAELAGVRAGDLVTAVDGHALAGLSVEDAAKNLEGPRGKALTLDLSRSGATLSLRVVRDLVNIPAVRGQLLAKGRAYVAIEEFREGSGDELKEMLRDLERQNGAPLSGVVLDLRDNPGGILDEAVKVVDAFWGDATVVQVRDRTGQSTETHKSRAEAGDLKLVPVILINGGSASGSEIVAGALRDLAGSKLVGTKSYGKGSVQTYLEFNDRSALKMTIGRYVLPKGEIIEPGKGLVPDVEVPEQEETNRRALVVELEKRIKEASGIRDADREELVSLLDDSRPVLTGMDIEARLAAVKTGDDPQLRAALAALEPVQSP